MISNSESNEPFKPKSFPPLPESKAEREKFLNELFPKVLKLQASELRELPELPTSLPFLKVNTSIDSSREFKLPQVKKYEKGKYCSYIIRPRTTCGIPTCKYDHCIGLGLNVVKENKIVYQPMFDDISGFVQAFLDHHTIIQGDTCIDLHTDEFKQYVKEKTVYWINMDFGIPIDEENDIILGQIIEDVIDTKQPGPIVMK
jgi:hypothetical protein